MFATISTPVFHSFLMNQPAFYGVCYEQLYPVCEKIVQSGSYATDQSTGKNDGLLRDYIESVVGTEEDEAKYDIIFSEDATEEEINEVINGTKSKDEKYNNPEAIRLCKKSTDSILCVVALAVSYLLGKCFMLFFKMVIHGLVQKKEKELSYTVNYIGFLLGGFEGILYTWVIMAVSRKLWFTTAGSTINYWVDSNSFLSELYANDILIDILGLF